MNVQFFIGVVFAIDIASPVGAQETKNACWTMPPVAASSPTIGEAVAMLRGKANLAGAEFREDSGHLEVKYAESVDNKGKITYKDIPKRNNADHNNTDDDYIVYGQNPKSSRGNILVCPGAVITLYVRRASKQAVQPSEDESGSSKPCEKCEGALTTDSCIFTPPTFVEGQTVSERIAAFRAALSARASDSGAACPRQLRYDVYDGRSVSEPATNEASIVLAEHSSITAARRLADGDHVTFVIAASAAPVNPPPETNAPAIVAGTGVGAAVGWRLARKRRQNAPAAPPPPTANALGPKAGAGPVIRLRIDGR
jgi:hypothetical protein